MLEIFLSFPKRHLKLLAMFLNPQTFCPIQMRSQDIGNLNPTLQTLLDEFIVPSVKNLDSVIREAAVKAMGCACLRSLKAAKTQLMILLMVKIY